MSIYLYRLTRHSITALRLRYRVLALQQYLQMSGIECTIEWQYRDRKLAHKWSTAYSIANAKVSIGKLKELPEGKDRDGNQWLLPEWSQQSIGKLMPLVLERAIAHCAPRMAYAEEGYEPDDPRRYPNLQEIPVSSHVYGTAVDVSIDWQKLEGEWSDVAITTLAKFGLVRPFNFEHWHVELGGVAAQHNRLRTTVMLIRSLFIETLRSIYHLFR